MLKMKIPIIIICIVLINIESFSQGGCPLDPIIPGQDITELCGKWLEYKKSKGFLANNVCTTYTVRCPNNDVCNVNLYPNGTNTGYANTLITNGTYTMWGPDTIYLHVNSSNPYAVLWTCDEDTKSYELAVFIRELSDNDTIDIVNALFETIKNKHNFQLNVINNTLCSGATTRGVHLTATVILLFSCSFLY